MLTFSGYMLGWWTAGNQIISAVLSRPFSFGDYLEVDDIRALGVACALTHTICKWILRSVQEVEQAKRDSLQSNV